MKLGFKMGCICCKPSAIEDDSKESPRERLSTKTLVSSRTASLRREDRNNNNNHHQINVNNNNNTNNIEGGDNNNEEKVMLIDKQVNNGSVRLHGESFERKREKKPEYVVAAAVHAHHHHPASGTVPKPVEGEQVAAGWPTWLAAVAGEAIKGWVPRRADSFEKLDKV